MLKDELGMFLVEISKMFPVDNKRDYDNIIKQTIEYLWDYCKGKDINLTNAKRYVYDNYTYKSFPEPSFLKDAIMKNVVIKSTTVKNCGLLLLRLPDGYVYDFTMTDFGTSLEELQNKAKDKYGEGVKVKLFPKGSEYVNGKVWLPDAKHGEVVNW
jgi:hypothetical protein